MSCTPVSVVPTTTRRPDGSFRLAVRLGSGEHGLTLVDALTLSALAGVVALVLLPGPVTRPPAEPLHVFA